MPETQVPPHAAFLRLQCLQGITQIIDSQDGSVQNLAEFRVANAVNGALNVAGTVDPVRNPDGEAVRVDVKFTSFSLKLGSLPQLKIPLTWPKTPLVSFIGHSWYSKGFYKNLNRFANKTRLFLPNKFIFFSFVYLGFSPPISMKSGGGGGGGP